MVESSAAGRAFGGSGTDLALRVTVPAALTEVVGAILMDLLGPFEQEATDQDDPSGMSALIFYPSPEMLTAPDDIMAALRPRIGEEALTRLKVETRRVSRDWVEGWRAHFRPVVIGSVRIRPPWEPALSGDTSQGLVEVVINPGLGFGTGLHPTTRGVLQLLQGEGVDEAVPADGRSRSRSRGPLVDVGTGSGVLAIAAAKLGWGPALAFDNDAAALVSARENVAANEVQDLVEIREIEAAEVPIGWFEDATVLANMTLEPVSLLLRRLGARPATSGSGSGGTRAPSAATSGATTLGASPSGPGTSPPAPGGPVRLVVSGILAGEQEQQALRTARGSGFVPRGRVQEDEWVSLELVPASGGG